MNLESKREGPIMGEDSPYLIDHNGSPIESNNAVDHVIENSSIEQSDMVAATTPKVVAEEVARRQLPVYWGVYIDGFVQGIDATLTIETGACDMIMSHWFLRRWPGTKGPDSLRSTPRGAGGEPLKSYGKAVMEIQMGPLCFNQMCIFDEVCDSCDPAAIIWFEEKIMFRGATIPMKMVRPSVVKYVTAAESIEAPLMGEVIVVAYVDRHENQEEEEEKRLLAEMQPSLPEGHSCVLASLMVDIAICTMVSINVFNLHSHPVVIRQHSVVGTSSSSWSGEHHPKMWEP